MLLLLPSLATAAERLSRVDAVSAALLQNAELLAAKEELGTSEGELLRARLLLTANPSLSLDYGSDRLFEGEGRSRFGIGLSQELQLAGKQRLRERRALARQAGARARIDAQLLRLARDASDGWFALWRAERLQELSASALELNRALQKAAASRFKAGDIPELERNVVDVDTLRAEAGLAEATAAVARSAAELGRLMGAAVTTPVVDEAAPLLAVRPLEDLLKLARERRPELLVAQANEEAFGDEVALQERERIPNPVLGVAFERDQHLTPDIPRESLLSARLSVELPAWDRKQAEIRSAQASRGAAKLSADAARQQIEAEVRAAFASLEGARRAVEIYEATLPPVKRNLELLEKAFGAGEIGLADLIAAKDRAFAARRESIEARASHGRAFDELMRATGRLPSSGAAR